MKRNYSSLSIVAAAAVLAGVSIAGAAPLVDFKPVPTSPALPEFQLTPTQFTATIGSVSANAADPTNPVNQGGLLVETPFNIATAVPGKVITGTGSTQFFDTTLKLTADLSGAAQTFNVPGFGTLLSQAVTSGSFTLLASSSPANSGIVLLTGTFSTGGVTGIDGQRTASFQANAITFTGGVIFDALVAALGGATPTPGSLSISMNDLTTNGTTPTPLTAIGGSVLAPFQANATGLFSTPVIPEPGVATVLGAASLALVSRRRR